MHHPHRNLCGNENADKNVYLSREEKRKNWGVFLFVHENEENRQKGSCFFCPKKYGTGKKKNDIAKSLDHLGESLGHLPGTQDFRKKKTVRTHT